MTVDDALSQIVRIGRQQANAATRLPNPSISTRDEIEAAAFEKEVIAIKLAAFDDMLAIAADEDTGALYERIEEYQKQLAAILP